MTSLPISSLRLAVGVACFSLVGACSLVNAPDDVLPQGAGTGGTGGTAQGPGGGDQGGSGGGAVCGDGMIDMAAGETCDPPETCPICNDGVACTQDTTAGTAATCNVKCTNAPITTCQADGCCPPGCKSQGDPDCGECGNGILELGELCDGNCPTTCADIDACTIDTMTGSPDNCDVACVHAPTTACVSGDGCCPAGCAAATDTECDPARIYMTSSNGDAGFYEYTLATNTWATLVNPPSVTYSQLTTDGTSVYLLGADNTIYQYFPPQAQWFGVQAGPGPESSQAIGLFKWTPFGFYYAKDGTTEMRFSQGGPWPTITLPFQASCAGTYDPVTSNIYTRIYSSQGVMVFNTGANAVVQTVQSPLGCGENSRTGSYLGGFFYTRDFSSTIQRTDMTNGQFTDTGLLPSESHTSTDVDPATSRIYFGPYGPDGITFQMYEPVLGTLSTLAPAPVPVTNHSTIVVLRQ